MGVRQCDTAQLSDRNEMEERKKDDDEDEPFPGDVEDTLVETSDAEEEVEDEVDVEWEGDNGARGRTGATGNRATLWVILVTAATLVGRRILMSAFREFSKDF